MSNIAEGFESQTQTMFISNLSRAKSYAAEVRSQLYVAVDLEYISDDEFNESYDLVDKVGRQIYNLMKYLESQPNARRITDDTVQYEI